MKSLILLQIFLASACQGGNVGADNGSSSGDSTKTIYKDVTATHVPAAPNLHGLDAVMVDVDNDGDLDVVVAVEYGPNRLYLNDGTGILTYKEGFFGNQRNDNEHVRAADFNADGIMDVIFITEDTEVHSLYFGDGKGGFIDVSDRLPGRAEANGIAVGDVNGDGFPDIIIGCTTEGKSSSAQTLLWLNDPQKPGYFIDATSTHMPKIDVQAQGVALADIDGDGDLDMVIACQTPPNLLFLNSGDGRFIDATERLGEQIPMETREVHVFDANGDGYPDLVFFNLTSNNHGWDKDPQTRIFINDGHAYFNDETVSRLPKHRFSSWGGTVIDFNEDGYPDLLVSAIEVPGFVGLQVRAWQNDGNGNFSDVTQQVIPAETVGRSWSMAKGDINGDGKLDVFIGSWGTQARLLFHK